MGAEAVNDFFQKSRDKSTIRFCTRREQGIGVLLIIIIIIMIIILLPVTDVRHHRFCTKKITGFFGVDLKNEEQVIL